MDKHVGIGLVGHRPTQRPMLFHRHKVDVGLWITKGVKGVGGVCDTIVDYVVYQTDLKS